MKIVFVAWALASRRSESLSKELGAKLFLLNLKSKKTFLIKHFILSIKTLKNLFKEKPSVILVQHPPLTCSLICLFYSKLFGSKIITDFHTGPWDTWWERFWYWNKFIMKNSDLVIVTNRYVKKMFVPKNVPCFVFEDRTPNLQKTRKTNLGRGIKIVVVNSFAIDEPLDQILHAARSLSDIKFYITGKLLRAKKEFLENKPDNVCYTDFLPEEKYISLMRSADGIMILTTRNYCMLSGAHEALALGKPMIISDWPVLREFFNKGAIYVKNNKESIVKGIKTLIKNKRKLADEVKILKNVREREWFEKFQELSETIKQFYK